MQISASFCETIFNELIYEFFCLNFFLRLFMVLSHMLLCILNFYIGKPVRNIPNLIAVFRRLEFWGKLLYNMCCKF